MEDKELTLATLIQKQRDDLSALYTSVCKLCVKHDLDLITRLFDYLHSEYTKEEILSKLYDLYKHDIWEDKSYEFINGLFDIVKDEHYADIHKFGKLLQRDSNKYTYYHEFIDEIAGSVFESTHLDEVACDTVIAALRQVAKFIFDYPLSEFNEEENK